MPERIIKIDAEILEIEQKLRDVLALEKHEGLTAKLAELKKQRAAIIDEMEKKPRDGLH
jgi:hypothetical protein